MPETKVCASPECEREFSVNRYSPGQKYCCPQCKYRAALAIQKEKRLAKPKRYIPCSICGTRFHPERNELYCSDECRKEVDRREARKRYKANGGKREYTFQDSLAKLIRDPTDSWCVGHIMRLGQVCHDMRVDPTIWGDGVTFRTMDGKETLVVKNRGLVDEQGKIRFSVYKSDE